MCTAEKDFSNLSLRSSLVSVGFYAGFILLFRHQSMTSLINARCLIFATLKFSLRSSFGFGQGVSLDSMKVFFRLLLRQVLSHIIL